MTIKEYLKTHTEKEFMDKVFDNVIVSPVYFRTATAWRRGLKPDERKITTFEMRRME